MSDLRRRTEIIERPVREGVTTPMHCWYLYGERGIIQFKCGPAIEPSHRIALKYPDISTFIDGWSWDAWDLGYHSPRPTYDGQEPLDCDLLEGPCYYDGTSLGASDLLGEWAAAGCDDEVIWRRLVEAYGWWLSSDEETCASPVTALVQALKRSGPASGAAL